MSEPGNILKNDDNLSEEQLKKYLSGEATVEESHAVERVMADSEFINDAVEGLQAFSSENKMHEYVGLLNKNLNHHLLERKLKKEKRKIRDLSWSIIAVITILLLCILCFIIIKMLKEREAKNLSGSIQIYQKMISDNSCDFIL